MTIAERDKWLEEKGAENYAKGLFWLGALMKEAEKIKCRTNPYFQWEYQLDPIKVGVDQHDVLICYTQALEIVRVSPTPEFWKRIESYLGKIAEYLPNIPCDENLEERGKNKTPKMTTALFWINAGKTLA